MTEPRLSPTKRGLPRQALLEKNTSRASSSCSAPRRRWRVVNGRTSRIGIEADSARPSASARRPPSPTTDISRSGTPTALPSGGRDVVTRYGSRRRRSSETGDAQPRQTDRTIFTDVAASRDGADGDAFGRRASFRAAADRPPKRIVSARDKPLHYSRGPAGCRFEMLPRPRRRRLARHLLLQPIIFGLPPRFRSAAEDEAVPVRADGAAMIQALRGRTRQTLPMMPSRFRPAPRWMARTPAGRSKTRCPAIDRAHPATPTRYSHSPRAPRRPDQRQCPDRRREGPRLADVGAGVKVLVTSRRSCRPASSRRWASSILRGSDPASGWAPGGAWPRTSVLAVMARRRQAPPGASPIG